MSSRCCPRSHPARRCRRPRSRRPDRRWMALSHPARVAPSRSSRVRCARRPQTGSTTSCSPHRRHRLEPRVAGLGLRAAFPRPRAHRCPPCSTLAWRRARAKRTASRSRWQRPAMRSHRAWDERAMRFGTLAATRAFRCQRRSFGQAMIRDLTRTGLCSVQGDFRKAGGNANACDQSIRQLPVQGATRVVPSHHQCLSDWGARRTPCLLNAQPFSGWTLSENIPRLITCHYANRCRVELQVIDELKLTHPVLPQIKSGRIVMRSPEDRPSLDPPDLTGLFWTKQCENMSLERSLGYAEEAV